MYWDPLRRKEVAETPEERVRQWFITVLRDGMHVPEHMMMSEVSLRFGAKPWRADLVVWDRAMQPLLVVECKRPGIALDAAVLDQAIRYNNVLNVRYIIVTNGDNTLFFEKRDGCFTPVGKIPSWEEMQL